MGHAQRAGVQYENDIVNAINRESPETINAYRAGWADQPDIVITTPKGIRVVELKRTAQERFYIRREQLMNLRGYANDYTSPLLIVKFTHREPVCIKVSSTGTLRVYAPNGVNTHWTPEGNLRVDKPTLDQWDSSQAGRSDVDTILDYIGN